MNINVKVGLHNDFKAATAARGENMTDILKKFIQKYVDDNRVVVAPAPKKKGRR